MNIFLSAFAGSLLSTLPIGPINLILMRLAILRQRPRWIACVVGVLAADTLYSLMSLKYYPILNERFYAYENSAVPILAIILLAFGSGMFLTTPADTHQSDSKTIFGYGLFGFIATLIEPALPLFWLSWWSVAHLEDPNLYFAALGLFLGDFLVFGAYAMVARTFKKPGRKFQKLLSQGLGLTLIVIAILLLIHWKNGDRTWLKALSSRSGHSVLAS